MSKREFKFDEITETAIKNEWDFGVLHNWKTRLESKKVEVQLQINTELAEREQGMEVNNADIDWLKRAKGWRAILGQLMKQVHEQQKLVKDKQKRENIQNAHSEVTYFKIAARKMLDDHTFFTILDYGKELHKEGLAKQLENLDAEKS